MSVIEQDVPGGFHIAAISQEKEFGLAETRQSAPGRQVFDVTGAGDTVLATLALACAARATIREGAVLGNAAAGVVVSKLGTATLTPRELLDAIP
jgi:D-beta-D-heptose 7-phosphate kinase/D-beta-D-heptose 1-phosphate adenosyltransferase